MPQFLHNGAGRFSPSQLGSLPGPHLHPVSITRLPRRFPHRGGEPALNGIRCRGRTVQRSAPPAPRPPAFGTAIASDGGHAPAMGAMRTGMRMPSQSVKALARASGEEYDLLNMPKNLGAVLPPLRILGSDLQEV